MSPYAIYTEGLSRTFKTVPAVAALNLAVPPGIVFGFLGPNGSGKTTTLRLLLGLLEPTAGRAEVLGFDTRTQAQAIRARAGALLEHTGLYERLSAWANLDFYGRIAHLSVAERQARIQTLLTEVGLWERRHEPVGQWSRGMKQKLAVARTLLARPAVIFLDEPTAGLDPVAAVELHATLAQLAQQSGVTVFLTTHHLAEAEKLCAQVAVVHKGQLRAVGSPAQLRAQGGKPEAVIVGHEFSAAALAALRACPEVADLHCQEDRLTLHLNGQPSLAPLITLLVQHGAQIEEVRRGQSSLEEVFLKLVEEEKT